MSTPEPVAAAAELLPPLLPASGSIEVQDCEIRWYAGGEGGPTVMLVHGGGANAGWWEPLLATLTARQRVIAIDLSGHGDSGRRDAYPSDLWTSEVAAVIAELASEPVALVGHSLGGRICTLVTARHPELVRNLVTLDAVVPAYDGEPIPQVGPMKVYDSLAEILAAFRLMPPQPPVAAEVMGRLARRSIRQLEDGRYTWKFDRKVFGQMGDRFGATAEIPLIRCPVTIVIGALSEVMRPWIPEEYVRLLGRPAEIITFEHSNHHIPLDAPEELDRLLARVAGP